MHGNFSTSKRQNDLEYCYNLRSLRNCLLHQPTASLSTWTSRISLYGILQTSLFNSLLFIFQKMLTKRSERTCLLNLTSNQKGQLAMQKTRYVFEMDHKFKWTTVRNHNRFYMEDTSHPLRFLCLKSPSASIKREKQFVKRLHITSQPQLGYA